MSFYDEFPSFKFRDRRGNHSNFVDDLRKELDDQKMFDGSFPDFFGSGRPDLRSRMSSQNPGFFSRFDTSPSRASGSSQSHTGERVIPIHVCDEDGNTSTPKPSNQQQQPRRAGSEERKTEEKQKPGSPKPFPPQRNLTAEMPQVKEISRGQRAQSAPPSANEVPITECGGGQSKKPAANTGIRHIPIVIENSQGGSARSGSPAPGSSSPKPQQQTSQQPAGPSKEKMQEQESKPTPPKKPTLIMDPMAKIKAVVEQVNALSEKVKAFNGPNNHKDYLYLDEMLTRLLIQLDDVEVEGKDDVRQARRECIKLIQSCISELEARAQNFKESSESSAKAPVDKPPATESPKANAPDPKAAVGDQGNNKSKDHSAAPPVYRSEVTMTVGDTPAESSDTSTKSLEEKMDTA